MFLGRNCPKFVPKPNTQAVKTCMSKSGSKCLLRCNSGYSLSNGTTIIKCLRNGRWSSKGPSCTGEDDIKSDSYKIRNYDTREKKGKTKKSITIQLSKCLGKGNSKGKGRCKNKS